MLRRYHPSISVAPAASLLVLASSLLSSTAAVAQESSAEGSVLLADAGIGAGSRLETVTVSARRREENVQDVPIPIATLSGDALEQAGQFRLEDLNQRLPSTNVFFSNPRQTSIAVRGLGNNPANDALESSVGVYLDNVYLGRPGMANLDLIDIDQVELLRGPQGTLFGKNTTGGVLNISTRQPTFEPEVRLESSYGKDSYEYYQVRGSISGGLSDSWAGRLSAATTNRDGFIDNPVRGLKLNDSHREGFRGQLLFKPNEDFSLRLIGDYNTESSNCCVGVMWIPSARYDQQIAATGAQFEFDPEHRTVYSNSYQHMQVRQGGYSAEANWNIGESKLTSITAYRYWWFEPINDADNTSLSAIINAGQSVDDEQWSQELRWTSPGGRTVEYVAGLFYFYQSQDNLLQTEYGPDAGNWLGRPRLQQRIHVYSGKSAHSQSVCVCTGHLECHG